MPEIPKGPGAERGSSGPSLSVPASLKKDGLVIIRNTPKPTEELIPAIMRKDELAMRVVEDGFSNSSKSFNSSDSSLEQDILDSDSGSKSTLIVKPCINN